VKSSEKQKEWERRWEINVRMMLTSCTELEGKTFLLGDCDGVGTTYILSVNFAFQGILQLKDGRA
jgi:hypothetical protein